MLDSRLPFFATLRPRLLGGVMIKSVEVAQILDPALKASCRHPLDNR